jgi:hypothetical protein
MVRPQAPITAKGFLRELRNAEPKRAEGRYALTRSLEVLYRRVHRFGSRRAPGGADFQWALRVCESLYALLPPERLTPKSADQPNTNTGGLSE